MGAFSPYSSMQTVSVNAGPGLLAAFETQEEEWLDGSYVQVPPQALAAPMHSELEEPPIRHQLLPSNLKPTPPGPAHDDTRLTKLEGALGNPFRAKSKADKQALKTEKLRLKKFKKNRHRTDNRRIKKQHETSVQFVNRIVKASLPCRRQAVFPIESVNLGFKTADFAASQPGWIGVMGGASGAASQKRRYTDADCKDMGLHEVEWNGM